MSLITRCPACGTMFKVVTDQLKVSQGWVRCGHCSEVFDASLHLTTVQAPVAPSPTPALGQISPPLAAMAATPAFKTETVQLEPEPEPEPAWLSASGSADQPAGALVPEADGFVAPLDAGLVGFNSVGWNGPQRPPLGASSNQPLSDCGPVVPSAPVQLLQTKTTDTTDTSNTANASATGYSPDSFSAAPPDGFDDALEVSFVRDARRQALWRKPAVRAALVLLSLLFGALLLLQVVIQQRDSIAARQPALKPWLQLLCSHLHCELGPVRRIESVVIDSSSFNKINNYSYRLSFSLKNTGATPLAMPALEVTLTDTQDQALLRRVLAPAQFGAANMLLFAGADFSGMVVIQVTAPDAPAAAAGGAAAMASPASAPLSSNVNPLRIAGYRVLAFYP